MHYGYWLGIKNAMLPVEYMVYTRRIALTGKNLKRLTQMNRFPNRMCVCAC